MSLDVRYSIKNELTKQEIIMEPPKANYDEFNDDDEESNDEIDGMKLLPLKGIDDGLVEHKPKKDQPENNFIHGSHHPLPDKNPVPAGYFPQWSTSYPPVVLDSTIPSLNLYQQKKSLAQGMLDLALLSANANQLRYVLEYKERNHYYYVSLTLISLSLVLQVLVAVALVFKSRYNIDNEQEYINADRINNFITMGILFITIINVFTSAFGVMPTQSEKL